MSSKRRIWSLPLVLVTALLLVGLFASSVLAQTPSGPTSVISSIDGAPLPTNLATVEYENLGANAALVATAVEAIPNDPQTDADESRAAVPNPRIVSGNPMGDWDDDDQTENTVLFAISDATQLTDGEGVNITLATGGGQDATDVTEDRYTLVIESIYDADTGVNSDGEDRDGTGGNSEDADDQDHRFRTTVDIYIVRIDPDDAAEYHIAASGLIAGDTVSSIGNHVEDNPTAFDITGLAPNAAISATVIDGAADTNFELFDMGGNKVGVRVETVAVLTTDQAFTGSVYIDTNTAEDNAAGSADADTTTEFEGDGNKTNDRDILLQIGSSNIQVVQDLALDDTYFFPAGCDADESNVACSDRINAVASIRDDIADDHLVHTVAMTAEGGPATEEDDGADEDLDGVVTGDSRFDINDDLSIAYKGGTLTEGEVIDLLVTVNGDTGMSNRTVSGRYKIMVTATNSAPTAPESVSYDVPESDKTDADLITIGTEVADLSGLATDPEGTAITYTEDSAIFDVQGGKLVFSQVVGNITAAIADDPDTANTDESRDAEPPTGGWECTDDSAADGCGDITVDINLTASDGVASNNQTIKATVTVEVNEPVTVNADSDLATAGAEYETTDVQNHVIVDLADHISGSDSPLDDVTYDPTYEPANPPFGIYDGSVRVNYPGPTRAIPDDPNTADVDESWDPEADGWTITVLIGDVFDNSDEILEDEDDATSAYTSNDIDTGVDAVLIFTIKQIPGPPLQSFDLVFEVDENAAAGTVVGTLDVEGATSYQVISGTGGARDDFAVDVNTGEITVVNGRDYDAADAENNIVLLVDAFGENGIRLGAVIAGIAIQDIDEDPVITTVIGTAWVYEDTQVDEPVLNKVAADADPSPSDPPIEISANDPEGTTLTYSIVQTATAVPFAIDAGTGALTVTGALDRETIDSYSIDVVATDAGNNESEALTIVIHILDTNEAPEFTSPLGDDAATMISEARTYEDGPIPFGDNGSVTVFQATDEDGDDLSFGLIAGPISELFEIANAEETADGEWQAELRVKQGMDILDYEDEDYDTTTGYFVQVVVQDGRGKPGVEPLRLIVKLENLNDETPTFDGSPLSQIMVEENTPRGSVLGTSYAATDPDGFAITYDLTGNDEKWFQISDTGDLMTLASLDYDNAGTPCGTDHVCMFTVVASDGAEQADMDVSVTITNDEDSVSTLKVSKANPVPGPGRNQQTDPMTALSNVKTTVAGSGVPERPSGLPATYGDAPKNFVATEWGNWGTVLRIAVTSESPDPNCGDGNQCVVININSDSADDALKLQAYRSSEKENQFVAAVMLVEQTDEATPGDDPVYMHSATGGVPAIRVDEEDEIEVEFGNLRDSIDVENEAPEISNFAPEHDTAFDDADVEYTFTVTDANSGLPEPEDLPDADGDDSYTPVVALISRDQCETHADTDTVDANALKVAASIHEDETLYCPGTAQTGEYIATGTGFGFAPIRDDKDFDEIDNGYEVETTIVLDENRVFYVTFIVCDNAGNCTFYDPDGNDDDEELAQITVDTEDPEFVEARTGLTWDSTDNEYDDNRSFIQLIFDDLTSLNVATVEIDDFVVEGHSIKDVHVFENPDDDDVTWGDSGRYVEKAPTGINGKKNLYQDIENSVFVELEDELLADETPDVTIVPNGVEDDAGNEQDDGDHEADDWISPKFTIVSITSTLETSQDEVLAGDGDEVTIVVTADERLDQTRPTVTVTYVKAPAGSVDTKGVAACKTSDDKDGTRSRGEIVLNSSDRCGASRAAGSSPLNNSVEKVSNTEWIVTITEPKATGYYNFRIEGKDRSTQENPGSEGIAASSIVTDFFDSDGDVNADDAVFFEGDINLAKPNVRVSGMMITDNEPSVEYRSPLFVEIDFTRNHMRSSDCGSSKDRDHLMANCQNENSEYAEDNFDDIVVTMFELDGVDMTDSVKTTDDQTFLVTLESVALGDHTAKIQAMDVAGNILEDILEIDFEVSDRDPFEKRLSPGWNLVSLPGEPADSSIASVFGPGVEVRTVYTYDPVIPGGWMVAVRETLDSDWQGDLTEITGMRGYWVLSDAIQDWEVSIPRLAGGAAGTGTPIQPPVIPLYAGWNLIPVTDVKGNALSAGVAVSAETYLQSLESGVEPARVLGFDTIRNEWYTVLDGDMTGPGMGTNLEIGSAYWVFVREATSLVPGGAVGGGSGD